ncbi:MAG TPA: DUF6069 family protein [Bacteroidia bacterium]
MIKKLNLKQSIIAAITAAVVAAAVNAILFLILHAVGVFTDDIMIQAQTPLSIAPVLMSSIMPLIIAGILFFILERYTQNGYKIFSIISIIFLLLSFINPFALIPGVTIGYGIGLNVMHIVAAASILYFIKRAKSKS